MNAKGSIVRASLVMSLYTMFLFTTAGAQPVAGPKANPLPRMNCATAGEIRADNGTCVPVESYFSTGSNKIYWIDGTRGSNNYPGTKSQPWRTIARANMAGVLKPGDAVIIRKGIYRETIILSEAGQPNQRITFAAYPGENVVISGADLMNNGWTQSGNAWRHTWTTSLPGETNKDTVAERPEFRREMVIIDGKVLTPVYSRSAVVPGTFYVEGSDVEPVAIYMRLPNDDAPSGHRIEVGKRSALFLPKGSTEDWCGSKFGYYRVVGLTFRHAANNANWGAVCTGWEGSLLEEITVEWTNGTGIAIQGVDNVLRGNVINYNGLRGIGGRCQGCQLEFNETSGNNWKNHEFGYAPAGIKLIYSKNMVISNHLASYNVGPGIWYDRYNEDNIIENSILYANTARGILLELGTVRTLVRNNIIYGTKLHPVEGSGIQSQAASHNRIIHNTIVGNEGYGIWIRTNFREPDGYNQIYNNLLIGNARSGQSAHSEIRIDGESLANARTNVLNGNLYWPHSSTGGSTFFFKTDDGSFYRGNEIGEWRTWMQADASSRLLDPSKKQIRDIGSPDGWQLLSSSQALGFGVALPTGIEVPNDIQKEKRPLLAADVGADQFSDVSVVAPAIVETGTLFIDQDGPTAWTTVKLGNVFLNPVVILSPVSSEGPQPAFARARNVTSRSFEVQVDEWEYMDGKHKAETIHYAVFEAGRHVLANGLEIEAGHVTATENFSRVPFTKAFSRAPIVLSQIVTVNDPRAAVTRQHDVRAGAFELLIQGEERNPSHGNETVAYVAISPGAGMIGNQAFVAKSVGRRVRHTFYPITFGATFSAAPVFLASMQTTYGKDSAALRYRNLSGSSVEVVVEEEQSADLETNHMAEVVGYIVIDSGATLAKSESYAAASETEIITEAGQPSGFDLLGNYPNPFNPETTIRYELPEDMEVKLEVYDLLGRRVALLVDGPQMAGAHSIRFNADGLASGMYLCRIQAGSLVRTSRMTLLR